MSKRALDEPLVFDPYFRPQIWGGRRFAEFFGMSLPVGLTIGEAWEISVHPLHESQVSEGIWKGTSLRQLWEELRRELLGEATAAPDQFPWLIKWLDCHELLSVQVHPDDSAAQRLLGESFGKTESWVVLHAEPSARIYAGLLPGVTRGELAERSRDGTVAECLHAFVPKPGDCVHIPAGTVHAIGGGVLLAEIQQTSDATFRLFDWNRVDAHGKSRQLHIEQALEVIDFDRGPVSPLVPRRQNIGPGVDRDELVDCSYYRLDRLTIREPWVTAADGFSVWIVFSGAPRLSVPGAGYQRTCRHGDVVLVPAAVGAVRWSPTETSEKTTMLAVHLPDKGR